MGKLFKYPRRLLTFLVFGGLLILIVFALASLVFERAYTSQIKFGVTFSPVYAKYLNLDWQKTYIRMLDDLRVRSLRIPSYWNILEPEHSKYDFSDTDYMLNEASKRGAKVILVLGAKQPRWPECHVPAWAKSLKLQDRQQRILEFIGKTVERYKDYPAVWAWQIENEPLLSFGDGCDIPDKNFLKKELELVRSLSDKVVIMTDSGELGFWVTSMQLSDIFGTTLYRQVYDKSLGYITYPLPPFFYSIKSSLVRNIFAKSNKKTIIVELQAEPWLAGGFLRSPDEQRKLFTTEDFKNYVSFAQKVGFDEAYLWGVEWWYFMAQQGYLEYLDYARMFFKL